MEKSANEVLIANEPATHTSLARDMQAAPDSSPGTQLFVINLCASMAPISNAPKTLPGLETCRLYQVTRREDGRTRYRLRLGFFADEAAADAALSIAREVYPTAFTTCLCDEDQKYARGYAAAAAPKPKISVVVDNSKRSRQNDGLASTAQPSTPTASVANLSDTAVQPKLATPSTAKPAAPRPISKSPAAPAAEPKRRPTSPPNAKPQVQAAPERALSAPGGRAIEPPKIESPSKLQSQIELSLASEPPAAKAQPISKSGNEPFRVGRGVDIPATSLSLEAEADSHASEKTAPGARAPSAVPIPAPSPTEKPTSAPRPRAGTLPDLDSTQTIRALTRDELEDEAQERWYAIQLAVSDQPVNLDAMPHLDIFEAYRLYSVAHAGSGKITHALRLGFFREEVSAEAVCGYLKTFFAAPTVVRISIAEHTRFKDPPKPKVPAKAAVLDLGQARERGSKTVPTVTMEVPTPRFDPNATGAFKTSASGLHPALTTGSHAALNATGTHRALATGAHKAFKTAAKSATPPTKRSTLSRTATGKHKALQSKKSLEEQLLEEAREVELSASGIRKLPKNDSLLAKMLGKLKG